MLETTKPQSFKAYSSPHADLREFIERAEAAGELLRIKGADWNLEMGTIAEIVYHAKSEPPAILFEDVPGYPKGMRLLSGATNSSKRLAITLGFPVPRNHVNIWMSPGKHGRQIREKYFRDGKPCPVLISCGHDPLLFLAGGNELKFGMSEYDYAAGHRGMPYDVVLSELHGLPMPAHAEIVLEGEMVDGALAKEGPFGEFTGYYASSPSEQPVVHVKRVYYRNDPIISIASPMRPPSDFSFSKCVMKAGMIWDEVERAGLSGVKGVWCHEAGGARMFNVIAIKQAYPGHARQAAMLAASCQSGSYLGRFVVVVDEDVDPTDMFDVLWAMCTRCDPAQDIEFIRRAWSGPLDPILDRASSTNSRALIDACRPFERLKEFPPVARASPELRARVGAKFADVLARFGI